MGNEISLHLMGGGYVSPLLIPMTFEDAGILRKEFLLVTFTKTIDKHWEIMARSFTSQRINDSISVTICLKVHDDDSPFLPKFTLTSTPILHSKSRKDALASGKYLKISNDQMKVLKNVKKERVIFILFVLL